MKTRMLRDGGLYHEPGRNAQFFEKRGAGHLRDVRAELRNHCPRYDPPRHPILAIFNGTVTGREVGSTADIFGDIGDYDESIYQNKDYINQLVLSRDGRTLKSSTFNIVGEDYHFALGINLDITNMVRAGQMLSELTATSGDLQQTLMQDARSQLEELLRRVLQRRGQRAGGDEKDRPHAHHPHAL